MDQLGCTVEQHVLVNQLNQLSTNQHNLNRISVPHLSFLRVCYCVEIMCVVSVSCSCTGQLACVLLSDMSCPAGINRPRWTWATSNWRLPRRPWWTSWQRTLTTSGPETAYGRAGPTASSRSVWVFVVCNVQTGSVLNPHIHMLPKHTLHDMVCSSHDDKIYELNAHECHCHIC